MIASIINGALRLVAIVAIAWMVTEVATPWLARHEITVLIRPNPHPILRATPEWRT